MSEQPVRLSARDAAARCGVSDRTVRRWIASGRLAAERNGRDFRIDPAALEPFIGQSSDADSDDAAALFEPAAALADVSEQAPHPAAALSEGLSEVLRMLDERDRTIMELAGRVGFYQARVQELEGRLLMLEAPKVGPETPITTEGVSPADQVEPPQEPHRAPWPRRAWAWLTAAQW